MSSPAEVLPTHAEARPEHLALVAGRRVIAYGELEDRVRRAAAALAELGVSRGDRVAVLLLGGESRPGSIGLPLPGVDVRLVDEHGEEVDEGDPGEIVIRGPNVFAGYWRRPEETEAAFRDGWLLTGDVAYRDEDGYLHIVDRSKDVIIVSGFNVFPKEVEDAIAVHPNVAECAVLGVPDERTGEAVKALVVIRPGERLTEEEVMDQCRDTLARFKWPRQVEFVDSLPRHVTGKVLRRALRENG